MIPFFLVTGFLGSGKTTLLKHLLQQDDGRKWAVIQNEFAPSGVDGRELKEVATKDFYLEEINNGSVFCVCQMGNFISLLKQILTSRRPDAIVLEASGLSDPFSIVEILQQEDLSSHLFLSGVVAVADAVNFERSMAMLPRVRHQLRIADLVLINKIDLINTRELQHIHNEIEELNPLAKIKETQYCNAGLSLFDADTDRLSEVKKRLESINPDNRPSIKTGVFRTHEKLKKEHLSEWMNDMSQHSIRFKGYLKLDNGECVLVQSVFGQHEMRDCKVFDERSEIIGLGDNLDIRVLRTIYIKYL